MPCHEQWNGAATAPSPPPSIPLSFLSPFPLFVRFPPLLPLLSTSLFPFPSPYIPLPFSLYSSFLLSFHLPSLSSFHLFLSPPLPLRLSLSSLLFLPFLSLTALVLLARTSMSAKRCAY